MITSKKTFEDVSLVLYPAHINNFILETHYSSAEEQINMVPLLTEHQMGRERSLTQ